jgi:poly-gamma-glutamate synthesis protein (capsule biosynthesis protein)
MYVADWVPVPWRVLQAIEAARLAVPLGRVAARQADSGDGPGDVRLAALGDVWLREPPSAGAGPFAALLPALRGADVVCCNLEAPIIGSPAGLAADTTLLGKPIHSASGAAEALKAAGIDVANVAGNHAVDFGAVGFRQSLEQLERAGVSACGMAAAGGGAQLVERGVRNLRLGFLGYCDDHAPLPPGTAGALPAQATPSRILADVAAAAARVDALVVQLHWGYEFRLHPLHRHRELARQLVDHGAALVLCHHAHVPMGIERRGAGLIAYGLGNAAFPMTPYLRAGHPWSDRSFVLEVRLARGGVLAHRLLPFRIEPAGVPRPMTGSAARALLRGVAIASRRLQDERFLLAAERAQLVYEAVGLLGALEAARGRDDATLAARVSTLALPRQAALLGWLASLPGAASAAAALRKLECTALAGAGMTAAFDAWWPTIESARAALRHAYSWRAALAARVP